MFARVRLRLGAASAAAISHVTPADHAANLDPSFAIGKRGRIGQRTLALLLADVAGLRRRGLRAA